MYEFARAIQQERERVASRYRLAHGFKGHNNPLFPNRGRRQAERAADRLFTTTAR